MLADLNDFNSLHNINVLEFLNKFSYTIRSLVDPVPYPILSLGTRLQRKTTPATCIRIFRMLIIFNLWFYLFVSALMNTVM